VQAAGLLELGLSLAAGREAVAGCGIRGEEAVGVDVRATQLVRLDDLVGCGLTEPQGHRMPVLTLAVDHRPLVQAEATERAGPGCRAPQDQLDRGEHRRLLALERGAVDHEAGGRRPGGIPAPSGPRGSGGIRELDARARVPAPQKARRVRVVGEEEVLDRMPLASRHPVAVPRGERLRALEMGELAGAPGLGVEHVEIGRAHV
jgi:hypothetical protein